MLTDGFTLQRLTVPSIICLRAARCSAHKDLDVSLSKVAAVLPETNTRTSVSGLILAWRHYPWSPCCIHTNLSNVEGRGSSGPGSHRNSLNDFGEARGSHAGGNLQNFYAAQRHQSSRGSNEAEQMMQAKRRMAAQRERELRNYHQEQQYNRSRPPSTV